MVGTGKDHVHLLVVCTAERGLCGGFNSTIVAGARPRATRLLRTARRSRSSASARRASTCCAATSAPDHRPRRSAPGRQADRLRPCPSIAPRRCCACSTRAQFDVATLFFSRFKSVISQMPTALQIIPAKPAERGRGALAGRRRRLRIRAGRGRDPRRPPAAQHRRPDLPRAARERRLRAGRADERHGQRHPQCRRHDRQADPAVQPPAPGPDHQGTDRDHLRRRGALDFDM